jgi:hypothetical protein
MSNVPPHAALLRLAWRTLQAQRGETITYHVGSYSIVIERKAVLTRPVTQQVDTGENLAIESRAWDWLIDPDDLVDANGDRLEPDRGHRIEREDGIKYSVQPSDAGALAWRWSDGSHTWRRVHAEET